FSIASTVRARASESQICPISRAVISAIGKFPRSMARLRRCENCPARSPASWLGPGGIEEPSLWAPLFCLAYVPGASRGEVPGTGPRRSGGDQERGGPQACRSRGDNAKPQGFALHLAQCPVGSCRLAEAPAGVAFQAVRDLVEKRKLRIPVHTNPRLPAG